MGLGDDVQTTTSSGTSTSPGKSTELPLSSTTTSTPVSDHTIHTTSLARTTESPGQKLQQFVEEVDISDLVRPEDILTVTSNINDIISADSPLPPSVLKSAADAMLDLADAMKGSQGASAENMGTIANAMVQTASIVVDMLPETPVKSTTDSLSGSDVDINNMELSPKQQVERLKKKNKEKENAQRETAESIVTSLDKVADTLLALQPANVAYRTTFNTERVAVAVVRSPANEDIQVHSGQIVANIPGREMKTQTNDVLDFKMSVFQKNPYSWAASTGGQNISSPVAFVTMKENDPGSRTEKRRLNMDFPFVPAQSRGQPPDPTPLDRATKQPGAVEGNSKVYNGENMTYYTFTVPEGNVVPVVHLNWWATEAIFHVYSAYGYLPTAEKYAEKRVVRVDGYEAWLKGTNFSISFTPNMTDHGGRLYVGVENIGAARSPRRSLVQSPDKEAALSLSVVGCSSWKDNMKRWALGDCDVKVDMKDAVASCKCHMTGSRIAVGTMTLPVPNSIDFINAFRNFRNLSDNAVVFSTVVSEYIVYILILVLLDFQRIRASVKPVSQ
ncbi:uncharacterized protein LOC144862319 [Branchiostoma floridae x Branchiostoma japonicum]